MVKKTSLKTEQCLKQIKLILQYGETEITVFKNEKLATVI